MSVWDKIWENDSYSTPELRKMKAKYKVNLFCNDLEINENSICVDIGCGGGYISKEIFDRYKCSIHSCDNSITAINYAKKHNMFGKSNYFLSSATSINLPDETADIVFCIGVLEHVSDLDAALKEIYRILKSNGKFIIISSNYYSFVFADRIIKLICGKWKYGYQKNWRPFQLKRKLLKSGFVVQKMSVIQGYGDFNKINNMDKKISNLFPMWGRYIQILGGKKWLAR